MPGCRLTGAGSWCYTHGGDYPHTSEGWQRLRRAYKQLCRAMLTANVSGALTAEEQLRITKWISALGIELDVKLPNMVARRKQ